MSFAAKLIEEGKYDEAVVEASKGVDKTPNSPLPLVDRAAAYELLERYDEAVADYERALLLDQTASVLETDLVDDSYFNALISLATETCKRDKVAGGKLLDRYRATLPDGTHHDDIVDWRGRLVG